MARRYRRRGHYRRSPNGGRHYVRAHAVTRSSRGAWKTSPARSMRTAPIRTRPPAALPAPRSRFIQLMPPEPNATCPICGARVYFWKNQSGSKVWFDALGHPWPRHPCLDLPLATTRLIQTPTGLRYVTKAEVREAQGSAEGPLPPMRVVTAIAPPETGGCLTVAAAVLACFLVLCMLNWWRLVASGDNGVASTSIATGVAIAVVVGCVKVLRRPATSGLSEAQAQWAIHANRG
jgi:hypothetical protein